MSAQTTLELPMREASRPRRDFGSSARLWGGFLGRAWLWFVAGCLVVTFVPMLFGWRPYVVESGSMMPRIHVGDVILSSPEHDAKRLLGHVTIFRDPAHPETVKSHRVIGVNKDGTLQTKGDANPSADSVPVPVKDVKGIGRLLVRWIGLPLIWVQDGAWLKLGLLVLSLWVAAVLVVRDHDEPILDQDDDEDPDQDPDDSDRGDGGYDESLETADESAPARWAPRRMSLPLIGRSRHRRHLTKPEIAKMVGVRAAVVTITAGALLLPTTTAAFSATTRNVTSTWTTAASFATILNGDFENGTTSWTGDCASSTSSPTPYHASADLSLTANPTGFFNLGQGTATCSQALPLTPQTSYTVTGYVYGTGVTVGVSGGATASKTVNTTGWQQVTLSFTTGASGTVSFYVETTTLPGGFLGWQQVTNTIYADYFSITSP